MESWDNCSTRNACPASFAFACSSFSINPALRWQVSLHVCGSAAKNSWSVRSSCWHQVMTILLMVEVVRLLSNAKRSQHACSCKSCSIVNLLVHWSSEWAVRLIVRITGRPRGSPLLYHDFGSHHLRVAYSNLTIRGVYRHIPFGWRYVHYTIDCLW